MARKKNINLRLNPLLSGPTLAERGQVGSPYREINLSDIDVDPNQPRRNFNQDSLNELAQSIKEYGVLSPILVRLQDSGTFRLVAGERRLRASRLAGLETIPALIDDGEEEGGITLAKQIVENVQREDLAPLERANAIGQLKESEGWSIREIAARLGISKSIVQRSLEILALPDDLRAALAAGASESKVLIIGQVENRDVRRELIARISSYTRDQLEEAIKKLMDPEVYHGGTESSGSGGKPNKSKPRSEDQRIIEDLQKRLGTKVILSRKKDGQGRLLLEFYTDDDLNSLYQKLIK